MGDALAGLPGNALGGGARVAGILGLLIADIEVFRIFPHDH